MRVEPLKAAGERGGRGDTGGGMAVDRHKKEATTVDAGATGGWTMGATLMMWGASGQGKTGATTQTEWSGRTGDTSSMEWEETLVRPKILGWSW